MCENGWMKGGSVNDYAKDCKLVYIILSVALHSTSSWPSSQSGARRGLFGLEAGRVYIEIRWCQ